MLSCGNQGCIKCNARALRAVPWYGGTRAGGNGVLGRHSVGTWTCCMVSPKLCLLSFPPLHSPSCVQVYLKSSCPFPSPHFNNIFENLPEFNLLDAILQYFVALTKAKPTASMFLKVLCNMQKQWRKNHKDSHLPPALFPLPHQVFWTQQNSVPCWVQKCQQSPCYCEPPKGVCGALHYSNLNQLSKKSKVSSSCGCKGKPENMNPYFGCMCKSFLVIIPFQHHNFS